MGGYCLRAKNAVMRRVTRVSENIIPYEKFTPTYIRRCQIKQETQLSLTNRATRLEVS